MISSRVGELKVPPWMTVIAPAFREMDAAVAVAALLRRRFVASTTPTIRVPAGMPGPETGMPASRPAVLAMVTEALPAVVDTPLTATEATPASAVLRIPPEMTLRMPPSGRERTEVPAAAKRTVIGALTLSVVPVKPETSVMCSPLRMPATASREMAETGTMFVPTRVAKLVTPAPSVTVAAALSVPTRPVKRSLRVVVVMPLTADWVPAGSTKRSVPPRRWEIGPRLRTIFWVPSPEST